MTDIARSLQLIRERIRAAADRAGRDAALVELIAVTKTVSPARILEARQCGIVHIGENRVQEALSKRAALTSAGLTWHFIGHIQTNKAKKVVENFDWVHSVDRMEAAEALSRHVSGRRPLPVLIEVKLKHEPNKSGATEDELAGLVTDIQKRESLQVRGLMAVPPLVNNPEEVRPYFRRLRELAGTFGLKELSMGMTHDFEIAIEEGATMVRIGTGLFGARG
jgi:pyridoxal phosphate enzyme (YggS family)